MRFQAAIASGFFLALSAFAQSPAPQPPAPGVTQALRSERETRVPRSVALSPDGKLLAYSIRGKEGSELHLLAMPAADPATEKLVSVADTANCSNGDPVWSPDSSQLAFTSTCWKQGEKPGQLQIFLYSPANGKTRQLTHLTGNLQQAAFSPDGKSIAFLFVENATRTAGALDAMKPFAGVIGEDGIEIQRVMSVNIADGTTAWLTPPHLHVFEFDWSKSSTNIAFIAANPPGENNWWVAQLYLSCVQSPDTKPCSPVSILDTKKVNGRLHNLQIAVPRWSPDDKQISFIGGIMSDQGSTGGDLYVIDAKPDSHAMNVTPNLDGTVIHESFITPTHIGFVEDRRGHTLLLDWDIETKSAVPSSTVDLGEATISGGAIKGAPSYSPANGGFTVWVQSSFTHAPEIWGGGTGAPRQITHFNDALKPSNRVESVEWENEGFHVQGWLAYPRDYDPTKKYPLIVSVHGGPTSSIGARWGTSIWPAQGYFEFSPNPRGSMGQGEAFAQANVKDFGYGDLRDILKGMDTIEAKIPAIDSTREGLTGWSYGGFMTMFAVTQTHRFKAAVAGAGIANWQSYYGENSIGEWMIPFFGASVYDDPAIYAKSSAITFIKNVTTPTLVIVGDRDGECPAPQSFEFWHALKAEGVKTQLVVYPNEGHGFRDPAHLKDRAERMVNWFAKNMK